MSKEIKLKGSVIKIQIEVRVIEPKTDIVAFVNLALLDNSDNPIFKVRGYTVKVKKFSNKPVFSINAPAFRAGYGFMKSFIVDDKELWKVLQENIVDEVLRNNGGKKPSDYELEMIDLDEIDKAISQGK